MSKIILTLFVLSLTSLGLIFIANLFISDLFYADNKPEKALMLNPFNPNFLINTAYFKAKNYQDPVAVKLAQAALNQSPADINFYKLQSQTLTQLATQNPNYLKDAIQSLEKAEQFAPTDPTIPFQIAQILEVVNRQDLAKNYYEKALKLKPNYDHAMLPLAQIYIEYKNYSEAKKLLEYSIEINPKNIPAKTLLKQISWY